MRLTTPKRRKLYQFERKFGYLLAILFTAVSITGVYTLHHHSKVVAFQLPLAAVALIALFASAGAAALSVVLSTAALFLIAPPTGGFTIESFSDAFRLAMFVLFSGFIIWCTRRFREESMRALESEARLVDLVDNLDHSIVWDARSNDLTFLLVGRKVQDLLGYSENEWFEMGGSVWTQLVPEEDHPCVQRFLECMRSGKVIEDRCEHRFITKDGRRLWFQTGAHAKDDKKTGRQLYAVSAEVTPLKEAQLEIEAQKQELETFHRTIEANERRLSSVLDTALDAIVTIDEDGFITGWNLAAEKAFGYSKKEAIGQKVNLLMPEPHRSAHDSYIENYKRTGIRKIIGIGREVMAVRRDGTLFPIDISVSEFWYDNKRHYTGILHDITVRKKMEAALTASEERFRVALKNAPITVYTCDKNLRYTWIYKLPDSFMHPSLIGKTDEEFLDASAAEPLMNLKRQVLNSGETGRATIRIPTKGKINTFDITAEPHRNENGEVVGLIVAALDVSEISEAKSRAEEASRAKTDFLANISHEIRTPIGVIQGFAELLLDQEARPDARQMLATIVRNTRQLTSIVGEVLDVSKIEADRLDLEMVTFSLGDLIDDVRSILNFKAEQKGLALRVTLEGVLPSDLVSDPTRLRQILVNLGSNAIKFTSHGYVEMIFRCVHESPGACLALEVIVRDTGIGMSREQQSRIFAPFVQADSSTSRKYGGTGLGLFISRRLARALGGDLWLNRSEQGKGSEFLLKVAVKETQAPCSFRKIEIKDKENEKVRQLRDAKIMLAEDSIDNQHLVSRLLEKHGAKLDVANNGMEALLKANHDAFDLILMDIQMPEVDGFEATRRLRESGFDGPIVALTAHALKEERDRALMSGFDGYVTKPINRDDLLSTITTVQHRELH